MTDFMQLRLFVIAGVVLMYVALTFILPKFVPYSRKQLALLFVTLLVLWVPMGWYILFVVSASKTIDQRHVGRIGLLNLGIGVPLFILIGRRILKIGNRNGT
jgi:hypothetical protein